VFVEKKTGFGKEKTVTRKKSADKKSSFDFLAEVARRLKRADSTAAMLAPQMLIWRKMYFI